MRLKATLLTLCLALSIAAATRWTSSPVKAETTAASICGHVLAFKPATATTAGSIKTDNSTYAIAPGTMIGGQAIIELGFPICLDASLNSQNQIVQPSMVSGSVITICGALDSYKPSTPGTAGSISINSLTYSIAPNTPLKGDNLASVGSNMCLTASLNKAGQIASPSALVVNQTYPIGVCGNVSSFTAATEDSPGFISIGGLNFTLAPGVNPGNVNVGGNMCLSGILDVNGRLVTPTSVGNGGAAAGVCGTVLSFKSAFGGVA